MNSNLHPVFQTILRPYTEATDSREERQFTGSTIPDLEASVERHILPFLDSTEACLRGYIAPELYLAGVLTHLALGAARDQADNQAYRICHELQQFIIRPEVGLPCFSICFGCGCMYVSHAVGAMREYLRANFLCGPCDGEDYD